MKFNSHRIGTPNMKSANVGRAISPIDLIISIVTVVIPLQSRITAGWCGGGGAVVVVVEVLGQSHRRCSLISSNLEEGSSLQL